MRQMKVLTMRELMCKIGQPVWVEEKNGETSVCFCEVVFDVAGLAFGNNKEYLVLGSVVREHCLLPMRKMNETWRTWDEHPTEQAMTDTPWEMDAGMKNWHEYVLLNLDWQKAAVDNAKAIAEDETGLDAPEQLDEETKLKPKYLAYFTWYKNGMGDMLHRMENVQSAMTKLGEEDTLDRIRAEIVKQLLDQFTIDAEDMKRETLDVLLDSQDEDKDLEE